MSYTIKIDVDKLGWKFRYFSAAIPKKKSQEWRRGATTLKPHHIQVFTHRRCGNVDISEHVFA